MEKKRIYYPKTTASQRKRLFEVWEETGEVGEACRQANVSQSTYYYWKERFAKGGYEALKEFAQHGPKEAHRTKPELEEKVIELKQAHSEWGKDRIAQEIAKQNNWVPLVSPNTVRRILMDAGLWQVEQPAKKKRPMSQSAEQPTNQDKR